MFNNWLKKRWKDLLFFIIIGLLLIPQVRQPVQVFIQRLFAGTPEEISPETQKTLSALSWSLQDLQGNSFNLSSSKGKVILINIWATWCPPCIAEMPSLQEVYNSYGNRVDFYFISNEKKNVLKNWMNKNEYELPIYISIGPIPSALNSSSLPTTYVIDKHGNIVIEEVGAHDWNSDDFRKKLDRLIQE